jgi:hypothetical protein
MVTIDDGQWLKAMALGQGQRYMTGMRASIESRTAINSGKGKYEANMRGGK